jgi:cytoskeletal protein RodZ
MESIGIKLKQNREDRGYSIEQVARDTNIARRYIEALENEDFSVFPGDPYLVGFLRNYAEYLGIDSQELVSLYRNLKLQEQPAPIEQLLERRSRLPLVPLFGIILAAVVVGVLVYLIGFTDFFRSAAPVETAAERAAEAAADGVSPVSEYEFPLEDEILEKRFALGDVISVAIEGMAVPLEVGALGESVKLLMPSGEFDLSMEEERQVDVNDDGEPDVRISVYDILLSDESAVIRFDRFLKRPASGEGDGLESADSTPAVGLSTVASRRSDPVVISSAALPEPFQVEVQFRGYSLFRYLSDGSRREERYFRRDELFRMDVDREIRIWVSNAGAVTARIDGREVSLGGAGEVSTKLIRWERAPSGEYELKLVPVY